MNPVSMRHELKLMRQGISLVAGIDEAGIGPLAGPVVAAAVILHEDLRIKGLDDSKKLSCFKREELFERIIDSSISVSIGIVDSNIIDSINILQASRRAMISAIRTLSIKPEHLLVDGIREIPNMDISQTCIKHGDGICSSIAAASIIAKVIRDKLMEHYDRLYPQYNFSEHKGYGTQEHVRLLRKYGPTPIHRRSYEPVSKCLKVRGFIFA